MIRYWLQIEFIRKLTHFINYQSFKGNESHYEESLRSFRGSIYRRDQAKNKMKERKETLNFCLSFETEWILMKL